MTQNQINEEVLISYLKGELTSAQKVAVEEWYDASPENQKTLGEIYYILYINDRINASAGVDVERSLKELKSRISARKAHNNRTKVLRRIVWRVSSAAAIVAVLASAIWTTASVVERLSHPITIVTQMGERSQVILPDGTKVWLNSSSSLDYYTSLFSRERLAAITGEAYFEVQHDSRAPFVVRTNGLDIKVLGTKFNVRNDECKHNITTILLEGSVMGYPTDNEAQSVRLRPSQQLVFDTQTHQMNLSGCTASELSINWINGQFVFAQKTLEEIVIELKRYYNIDIRFMDEKLKHERFSGNFEVEDGIYHMMSILQLTNKFYYKVNHNNIELYSK